MSIIPLMIASLTSFIITRSTIQKQAISHSDQIVTQIAENINFVTKYYDDMMSHFIVDPKIQSAIWKSINLKDSNKEKQQNLDYINTSISDFLSTKSTDISALGIYASGGYSFGVFPKGISPNSFFDEAGKENNLLKKIVSANGSPVWVSPAEWLVHFNKKMNSIIICRNFNKIDSTRNIVLIMELKTYKLSDLCSPDGIYDESINNTSFIIDENGNIVSHMEENIIGQNIAAFIKSKPIIDRIKISKGLTSFRTTVNNTDSYISAIDISINENWKLINIIDNSLLYRDTYKAIYISIIIWGICVFIAFIISMGISLNVSIAVKTVAKGLSDIAEGETHLDKRLEITSNDEIRDLVIAFNKIQDKEKENIKSIKNSQLELIETLTTLQNTQAQLVQSEKMASLGSLVAGIAHEINTPIGISVTAASHIMSKTQDFTSLLESKTLKRSDLNELSTTLTEAMEILLRNLHRASELIKSFKQVAVDQTHEDKRELNVKKYLEEIVLSLTPSLKKRKINIHINCDDNIQIKVYAGSVSQIITNLIMNSLMHAYEIDDTGTIVIKAYNSADNKLILEFSDDGKGMEQDVVSKIFDPFFTTKRGNGGTGLGLHLVYNIVYQMLEGTIVCKSEPGKGTSFVIEFPIKE